MPQLTLVDTVIDGLLDVLTPALAPRPVLDADEVTDATLTDYAVVGWSGAIADDGRPDTAAPAASSVMAPSTFGPGSRDETGTVTLAVIAYSGDTDLRECRATSLATLGDVEAALRADDTLGGRVASGWISQIDTYQWRDSQGAAVRRVITYSWQGLQD